MSWLDRIKNIPLEVTTGDGKTYRPIFNNASDTTNVNEAVFEFINREGALVKRGKIGVKQYEVEFHFLGEDAIDAANDFEESARDQRLWTISHPYYDNITVQPSTLNFNRNNLNDVVFTSTLYETITDSSPEETTDIQEDILDSSETISDNSVLNAIETDETTTKSIIDKLLDSAVTEEDYNNALTIGNEALNNINDTAAFMRSISNLTRIPARFYATVQTRFNIIEEAFNELSTIFSSKQNYYENTGANFIGAVCEAVTTSSDDIAEEQDKEELGEDYKTRNDVLNVSNKIITLFDTYLSQLSENQENGYLPNYALVSSLFNTVNKTTGQLFIYAQNALQQRTYILPEDLPLITLHHRLYGNIDEDSIKSFVDYNNLTLDELLLIKKEREIIYFI